MASIMHLWSSPALITTQAATVGGALWAKKAFTPEDTPPVPPVKTKTPPRFATQPKAPANIPGEKDITQAATIKDEKRRILKGLPSPTESVFAGDLHQPGQDMIRKRRLLGNNIYDKKRS